MSIGPAPIDEGGIETKAVDKFTFTTKKVLNEYFHDPIHYIFYGSLTAVIIGLLLGQKFSISLYIILTVLGILELLINFFYIEIVDKTLDQNLQEKKSD